MNLIIAIIVLAVIIIIAWTLRSRTKATEDRRPELRTSAQCKVCGQDNPLEARFCGNCGAILVAR